MAGVPFDENDDSARSAYFANRDYGLGNAMRPLNDGELTDVLRHALAGLSDDAANMIAAMLPHVTTNWHLNMMSAAQWYAAGLTHQQAATIANLIDMSKRPPPVFSMPQSTPEYDPFQTPQQGAGMAPAGGIPMAPGFIPAHVTHMSYTPPPGMCLMPIPTSTMTIPTPHSPARTMLQEAQLKSIASKIDDLQVRAGGTSIDPRDATKWQRAHASKQRKVHPATGAAIDKLMASKGHTLDYTGTTEESLDMLLTYIEESVSADLVLKISEQAVINRDGLLAFSDIMSCTMKATDKIRRTDLGMFLANKNVRKPLWTRHIKGAIAEWTVEHDKFHAQHTSTPEEVYDSLHNLLSSEYLTLHASSLNTSWQLCESNPKAKQIIIDAAIKMAEETKDVAPPERQGRGTGGTTGGSREGKAKVPKEKEIAIENPRGKEHSRVGSSGRKESARMGKTANSRMMKTRVLWR